MDFFGKQPLDKGIAVDSLPCCPWVTAWKGAGVTPALAANGSPLSSQPEALGGDATGVWQEEHQGQEGKLLPPPRPSRASTDSAEQCASWQRRNIYRDQLHCHRAGKKARFVSERHRHTGTLGHSVPTARGGGATHLSHPAQGWRELGYLYTNSRQSLPEVFFWSISSPAL